MKSIGLCFQLINSNDEPYRDGAVVEVAVDRHGVESFIIDGVDYTEATTKQVLRALMREKNIAVARDQLAELEASTKPDALAISKSAGELEMEFANERTS